MAQVHQGDRRDLGDDLPRSKNRSVSPYARSRRFVEARNDSIEDYANFAASAGVDLFNGEPLEVFAGVVKIDNVLLRQKTLAIREDLLRLKIEEEAGG